MSPVLLWMLLSLLTCWTGGLLAKFSAAILIAEDVWCMQVKVP